MWRYFRDFCTDEEWIELGDSQKNIKKKPQTNKKNHKQKEKKK